MQSSKGAFITQGRRFDPAPQFYRTLSDLIEKVFLSRCGHVKLESRASRPRFSHLNGRTNWPPTQQQSRQLMWSMFCGPSSHFF